jgi:phosphoserine phosphatase RsbU/P
MGCNMPPASVYHHSRPFPGPLGTSGSLVRDLSRQLQRALLPRNAPSLPGYDVAAGTTSEADGPGSTVWDWFTLPDGRPCLVTLDTAPGTFPPSHALAMVRAFLRQLPEEGKDVGGLLRRVNTAVSRTSVPGFEGHVDCGILVPDGDSVGWLSAGTVAAGVIRREGTVEDLPSQGPPLGLMDGFRYGAIDINLRAGDLIVVLSHGARGLFRGAADVVAELHGKPAAEVVSKLHKAVQRAGGSQEREHSVLFLRKK